jgi:hypothetical protein
MKNHSSGRGGARGTRRIRGSAKEISGLFGFGYDVIEWRNEDPRTDDPGNDTD